MASTNLVKEIKRSNGHRMEEALNQSVKDIAQTLDYLQTFEVFIIIQRGFRIGLFEYHNDISDLDEEDIPHFLGCVSLTATYNIGGQPSTILPVQNIPNVLPLYHDTQRLREVTDKEKRKVRVETGSLIPWTMYLRYKDTFTDCRHTLQPCPYKWS